LTSSQASRYRDAFAALAALLFPVTWQGRLAFVGTVIVLALPPLGLAIAAAVVALIALVSEAITSRTGRTLRLELPSSWLGFLTAAAPGIGLIVGFFALLASNGARSTITYSGSRLNHFFLGLLLVAIVWLLLGVPQRAYLMELDRDGKGGAQSLLVGLLTAAACILTGTFIWLLHYNVLSTIQTPQLVAGLIFTVALTPPYYSSFARACWQRGLFGIVDPKPLKVGWHQLLTQVQSAGAAKAQQEKRLGWLDRLLRALYTHERRSATSKEPASTRQP
jgi:MFS family permease